MRQGVRERVLMVEKGFQLERIYLVVFLLYSLIGFGITVFRCFCGNAAPVSGHPSFDPLVSHV